eukprot:snap_masked-scaffold109_size355148-processed-gene-0.1 protein:Tk11021 transcript:snap_masked-scaffold109_size355148-processed-gene-0.1-mRNA-1 annotation:"gram-positive signal peptide ysirk family"
MKQGGIWTFNPDNSTILCYCPEPLLLNSPHLYRFILLLVFFILAFAFALGLFMIYKTFKEARIYKSRSRRESESREYHFPLSPSNYDLYRRESRYGQPKERSLSVTSEMHALDNRRLENLYKEIPQEYLIPTIEEEEEEDNFEANSSKKGSQLTPSNSLDLQLSDGSDQEVIFKNLLHRLYIPEANNQVDKGKKSGSAPSSRKTSGGQRTSSDMSRKTSNKKDSVTSKGNESSDTPKTTPISYTAALPPRFEAWSVIRPVVDQGETSRAGAESSKSHQPVVAATPKELQALRRQVKSRKRRRNSSSVSDSSLKRSMEPKKLSGILRRDSEVFRMEGDEKKTQPIPFRQRRRGTLSFQEPLADLGENDT